MLFNGREYRKGRESDSLGVHPNTIQVLMERSWFRRQPKRNVDISWCHQDIRNIPSRKSIGTRDQGRSGTVESITVLGSLTPSTSDEWIHFLSVNKYFRDIGVLTVVRNGITGCNDECTVSDIGNTEPVSWSSWGADGKVRGTVSRLSGPQTGSIQSAKSLNRSVWIYPH